MAEILRVFVSATNDLEAERAVIGRALAELPVQVGAEIRRTPATGGKYDDIYEMIANCDRVYFLLGADITAPAGAEWSLALQLERSIFPLRSGKRLTLAAQEFTQNSLVNWKKFWTPEGLATIVTLDLIQTLRHHKNRYGLTVAEREILAVHAKRLQRQQANRARATVHEPGGAEGGGVLIDPSKEPLDGVILGEGED